MKKKSAAPLKSSHRKETPRIRTQKSRKQTTKNPPTEGLLWDDDRAFRVLIKNSSDIFALLDSRGKILYRSPSTKRVIALPDREVAQSNILEWIWPEDRAEAGKTFARLLRSPGESIPFQSRIKDEKGKPRWVEGIGTNLLENPAVGAVLVNYHDITDRKQQEKALEENERRYRELFERATLAIFQSTHDGKVIRVNPEFARMFGYDSPEDVFSSVENVATSIFADPARRKEIVRLRAESPELSKFENLYRRKDGSTFWGMLNIRTVTDAAGRMQYFEGFVEDIDDRKRSEQELRESSEKFRSIFDNSSAGVTLVDLNRRYLMVNPAFCRIFGYSAEELLGSEFIDITHPDDVELSRKAMQGVLDGKGKNIRFTKRYIHKDGHTIWADVSSSLVCGADGKPSHFVTHVLDITERRRVEEALRESEGKANAMMASAPYGITFIDGNGVITYANPAAKRILGLKQSEIASRTYDDPRWKITTLDGRPFPPEQLPFARVMATRKAVYDVEHTIQRENGERTLLSINGAPLFSPDGTFSGMVATIQDITERKQAEEALRGSEERYRSLFDNSIEGIGLSQGNRVIDANKALLEIFGYKELEEFRAIPLLDHVAPESQEFVRQRLHEVAEGMQPDARFTYKIVRKDGGLRDLEISTAHIKIGADVYTHSTFRDITERKRAGEALSESEEKFAKLFQDAPVLIIITDIASGACIDVNEEALRVFGYRRDEVLGKKLSDLGAITSENRLGFVKETQSHGRITGVEMNFRAKDGRTIVGLFRGERISISGNDCLLGVMVDITERKRAEEELHALAARHEALLSAIPEIVMEVDNDKKYTWANPTGVEFFGGDVIGKEAAFYFEGAQETYASVEPLFAGGEDTIYVESWQRRKDGQKRLLAWWCRTLKNDRGEVTGALSSARDITEQRQAAEEIQSLSRFTTENPNPVMRITPEGEMLYANNASRPFLQMWDVKTGQTLPQEYRALVGEVYLTNANREIEIPCGERIFTCTLTPIQSAGYINVYGRDITERKRAEESLTRQAEELRQRNVDLARVNDLNEHQVRRLTAMRAIDTAITSSFKLELVLNILLGQLTDLLAIPAADVLIYQPDLQTFRLSCGRGFRSALPQQTFIRKSESYANQAAQLRRIVRVPRLDEKADGSRIYPKIFGEEFYSYLCIPLLSKGLVKGVLEIYSRDSFELEPEAESFLELVAGQAAIAIDNAELFEGLQASNDELSLAYNDTLTGWARTLELRERGTAGEAQRLADMTVRLAKSLGTNEKELVPIYRGAILHDIGMMGIPDGILGKVEPLSEEEWTVVRKHPQHARDVLSSVNYLRPAIDIPYCHHEKWDGSGYPRGLTGAQIPWAARIFAVVDVWDALRSNRPYRAAWTDAEARDYIHQQSGKHFDPKVVQVFFEVIPGL